MAYDTDIKFDNKDAAASARKEESLIVKLRRARRRYASTFTMHAVEHILNGSTAEKIFWSLKLLTSLSTAVYLSSKLFISFYNHEVDTKMTVETQDRLQFPMILVGHYSLIPLVRGYSNCSSNLSVSYNENICKAFNQECPGMLQGRLSANNNATVTCDVLGQFMVVNADGKSHQTPTLTSLSILVNNVTASHLPLLLLIKAPSMRPDGKVDGGAIPKAWYDFVVIDNIGHYRFPLEKTTITRLPYPYTKPSCIKEDSDDARSKNIFRGSYGIGSCTKTCEAKGKLSLCKTMNAVGRYFIRDENYLREHFVDQPISNISSCLKSKKREFEIYMKNCVENCHNPCFEQSYKAPEIFKRGKKGVIQLSFYYELRKDTYIKQVPSYEVETLLSNFGGQMGLMVGMSAVSLVEVFIWSMLLLLEYLCRIATKETYMDTLLTENKMRLPLDLG